jgi:hypothetical protein
MSVISRQSATLANVSGSATSVALFAANGAAKARAVYNDSTAILYLKYGATASATSYTVQIPAGGYFEFPEPSYAGLVHGIWSSATGSARTTEVA